jgi:hypothetical protein
MIIKNDMKANNLIIGAVYINATTCQPCRLVNIVPCQGVWLESHDGQGYGDLVKFEDCHYATDGEVQDYLEDLRRYNMSQFIKKSIKRVKDYDTYWNVQGYYEDSYGNDIRCRD